MQINHKHILLLASLLCQQSQADVLYQSAMQINTVGDRVPAPGFVAGKPGGHKGSDNQAALEDYKDKVILLNFWATWCMPCRREMPGMEKLWQKYRDQGFVVLAVSSDEGSPARVETFVRKFDLSFPVLLDPDGEIGALYNVSSLPATFLIDRQGRVVSRVTGSEDWSSKAAFRMVETLLSE